GRCSGARSPAWASSTAVSRRWWTWRRTPGTSPPSRPGRRRRWPWGSERPEAPSPAHRRDRSGHDLVAGLGHGGAELVVAERGRAVHLDPPAGQVHAHVGHAGQLADLLPHRTHAVAAGHSADGDGGGGHGVPRLWVWGDIGQERTSRAIASEASRTFASASSPPWARAWATQCLRCSSSSDRAKERSALFTAEVWVSTSMQ